MSSRGFIILASILVGICLSVCLWRLDSVSLPSERVVVALLSFLFGTIAGIAGGMLAYLFQKHK